MPERPALDWTDILALDDEPPEAAHRRLHAAGLVDGLPVVPPTPARVRRLYREAGLDPARLVAVLEPALHPATVYDVAVCAALAGCAPEHLPVVCAALRATAEPSFNLLGVQTTTGAVTPAVIVSGPAVAAAGVSGGPDCLGGSVHANAAIGRAVRLALRILGGAAAGGMDAATLGQPAKLGLCFAENEAASPWPPLHVDAGFAAATGAVTVVAISGTVEVVHGDSADADDILCALARSMTIAGTLGSRGLLGGCPVVVLAPEHARALAGGGLSKADVRRALWQMAVLPLDGLPRSSAARLRAARHEAGDIDANAPARAAATPEDILVVVAGGVGVKSAYLPGWAGGSRPAIVRLDGR